MAWTAARRGDPPTPKWIGALDAFTPAKAGGAGVVLSALNPKNLLLTIAGAAAIAQTGISTGKQVGAFIVFVAVATIGVAAPVVIYFALGDRSRKILDDLKAWLAHNNAVIMATLLLIIGVKLIGNAIAGFSSEPFDPRALGQYPSVRTCALLAALVLLAGCGAGARHTLTVGVVDDAARSSAPVPFLGELTRSGFDALAVSSIWEPGETAPDGQETATLRSLASSADAAGVRLFVIVYQPGSATTPLTAEARSQFAAYTAAVVTRVHVRDLIVGNEPNLNRFWLPQFGPGGANVSAAAYLRLLATTYDTVKAAREDVRVWGGATAPRGSDRPGAGRETTSPTTFIRALGAAYRASGRDRPVMDGFVHHPYPESSAVPIDLPHPRVRTVGLADYDKLVRLLSEAFDGTAQTGGDLPILYGEIGAETTIPARKRALYTDDEIARTISERAQAAAYRRALELAACQPNVAGVLFFHLRDEPSFTGWQSGVRYADGTAKQSVAPVRTAVREAAGGELGARCNS